MHPAPDADASDGKPLAHTPALPRLRRWPHRQEHQRADAPDELRAQALDTPLLAIDRFMAEVEGLDHGVIQSAERTRRTLEKSVTGLLDRYARSTAQRFEQHLGRLDQLRVALAPNRVPQERILSPLHFAAVFGTQRLVTTLHNALHPDTAGQLTEVELW